jgi:tetratricopeptide (TPR) repeat protein/predicted Ser/Thr protein kinase
MVMPDKRKVGKYEIVSKLGRGGMADVYLAHDTEQGGRQVALKVIEHGADADSKDTIEAERRGSALQAKLAEIDPRVVQIYEAGDMDGYFGVAMEYVEGEDLADLMRGGPPPLDEAIDIALAICEALEHAHGLRIVHGDIKPKNIRIDTRNRVRVLDFGIAKELSQSRKLTRNEFGSVAYASPERLESGDVNFMSDLWSLGVLLYEMVTGSQPYQADNTERLERMIRSHIPAPPAPDPCPEPLRRILTKSMQPEPERRYQTAGDFGADLAAFRAGGDVSAESMEDADATRRTHRSEAAVDDGTRRTAPPKPAPVASSAAKPRKPLSPRGRQVVAALCGLAILWAWFVALGEWRLWKSGQQLEADIESENVTDIDTIWTRWQTISKDDPRAGALFGPRRAVRNKLVAAADRFIDIYRNTDTQPVYEKDWARADGYLKHALELAPGDDTLHGEARLCEAHIDRINGTLHHNAALLDKSVEEFQEAQRLLPHSPDPQLGLARVYVYGLKDIDKAYAALQEAERRGYKLGSREKAQLADGYRDRADRLWWDSRNVRGLPQEKDQIQKAADDYRRAMELYQSIMPYGNASAGIARVQGDLTSVQERLTELDAELTQ